MNVVAVVVGVVVAVALVAWYLLYITGGLERYFWSAALAFLVCEDVKAHHAAVVAVKLIALKRSRDNIIAALTAISQAEDTMMLLLIAADRHPSGRAHLPDGVRKRALQLAMSITVASDDAVTLRDNLRSVAPEDAAALSPSKPRPEVFSRLDQEAVRRVHRFFTS
jgi:hypothetical protein